MNYFERKRLLNHANPITDAGESSQSAQRRRFDQFDSQTKAPSASPQPLLDMPVGLKGQAPTKATADFS